MFLPVNLKQDQWLVQVWKTIVILITQKVDLKDHALLNLDSQRKNMGVKVLDVLYYTSSTLVPFVLYIYNW